MLDAKNRAVDIHQVAISHRVNRSARKECLDIWLPQSVPDIEDSMCFIKPYISAPPVPATYLASFAILLSELDLHHIFYRPLFCYLLSWQIGLL